MISDYGLYSLATSITLLYAGVGNAVFLTQMTVYAPRKSAQEMPCYIARILALVVLFCVASAIICVGAMLIINVFFEEVDKYSKFVILTMLSSIFYLLKDFFIRNSYNQKRESHALKSNIATSAFIFCSLGLFYFCDRTVTLNISISIYAGGLLFGACVGALNAGIPLRSIKLSKLKKDFDESWINGKWALGGSTITWLQSQAYIYITAIIIGPVGVGYASAARLIITPFQFLLPAANQIILPRMVQLSLISYKLTRRAGVCYTASMFICALIYISVIVTYFDFFTGILINESIPGLKEISMAWMIVLMLIILRDGASLLLQASLRFKALTINVAVSSVLAISGSVVLGSWIGPSGVIYGTCIGELILAVLLWSKVRENVQASN